MSLKYDLWYKEVFSKFGSFFGNEMVDFYFVIFKVNYLSFFCILLFFNIYIYVKIINWIYMYMFIIIGL